MEDEANIRSFIGRGLTEFGHAVTTAGDGASAWERIAQEQMCIRDRFYDREDLVDLAVHTVTRNLLEGIFFVTCIVLLFMADWRTTLIVSIIIPLALLFAFICLRLMGMSANLLSMGAIDFGIIIDGAVVMVEGLFVACLLYTSRCRIRLRGDGPGAD